MQLLTRDGEGWFRRTSVRAQSPFARGDHALFSLHKRKKFQKRSVQPCRLTAPTHRLPSKKFRPRLTQELSVQMGCHRGIMDSPIHGFFPTECGRQNPNFISRPARRMGTDGACAWGVLLVKFILAQTPVRAQNPSPATGAKRPLAFPLGKVSRSDGWGVTLKSPPQFCRWCL